jgi:hypothetical protein
MISADGPKDFDMSGVTDWYGATRAVSKSGRDNTQAIREFLLFSRTLFEPLSAEENGWDLDKVASIPLESDAQAIEYLVSHNFDVSRAKSNLITNMGFGKDYVHINLIREMVAKNSLASSFVEWRDKIFKIRKALIGAYDSGEKCTKSFLMNNISRAQDAENGGTLIPTTDTLAPCQESEGETIEAGRDSKDKRSRADKNSTKKRWQSLLKKMTGLRNNAIMSNQNAQLRPKLTDIHEILSDAAALPHFVDNPGENIFENLSQILGELLQLMLTGREWVSEMRDHLKSSGRLVMASLPHHREASSQRFEVPYNEGEYSIREMNRLVGEIENIGVKPLEESYLRKAIKDVNVWMAECNSILYLTAQMSAKRPTCTGVTEIETNSNPLDKASSKCSTDNKPSIETVNDLLMWGRGLPIESGKFKALQSLYEESFQHMETIRVFVEKALVVKEMGSSARRAKIAKPPIKKGVEMLAFYAQYPISLPRLDELKAIIDMASNWSKEVHATLQKTTPLRTVESLLTEGEKLPFEVPAELEILRDKKMQGKNWLSRLKKSLNTSTNARSTRKGPGGEVERLKLEDMKAMLNEGESFAGEEGGISKEMDKALDLVEAAEEWQTRVRETLASGDLSSTQGLLELLSEADDMPIIMDEVLLLKAQIGVMEWASKAKATIKKEGKPKLSDFQRSSRDLQKIRDSLPEFLLDELASSTESITEIVYITNITKCAEVWAKKIKSITHGGTIVRGTDLNLLRSLKEEAQQFPLNLENDLRNVVSVVSAAEKWTCSNQDILQVLGIPIVSFDLTVLKSENSATENVDVEDGGSDSSDLHATDLQQGDDVDSVQRREHIDIHEFGKVASTSSNCVARFPEMNEFLSRYKLAISWQQSVKEVCPKRQAKRKPAGSLLDHTQSGCALDELEALLQEGKSLRVDFPEEMTRITEVIKGARQWDNHVDDVFRTSVTGKMSTILNSYRELVSEDLLLFPFTHFHVEDKDADIKDGTESIATIVDRDPDIDGGKAITDSKKLEDGDEGGKVMNPEKIWKKLLAVDEILQKLQRDGEDIGLFHVTSTDKLAIVLSSIQWLRMVKKLLTETKWFDIDKDYVIHMVSDARTMISEELSLTFSENYKSGILSLPIEDIFPSPAKDGAPSSDAGPAFTQKAELNDAGENLLTSETIDSVDMCEKNSDDIDHSDSSSAPQVRSRMHRSSRSANTNWAKVINAPLEMTQKRDRSQGRVAMKLEEETVPKSRKKLKKTKTENSAKSTSGSSQIDKHNGKNETQKGADVTDDVINEEESFENDVYFGPFADLGMSLPPPFDGVIDIWLRFLFILLGRINEANKWSTAATCRIAKSTSAQPGSSAKKCEKEVSEMLSYALKRGLKTEARRALEEEVSRVKTWNEQVTKLLSPHAEKIDVDDMKTLIKKGERMIYDLPEIEVLREHHRKAKSWIQKLQKTGIENGLATANQLQQLLPEAETLLADVSEHVDTIHSVTKRYCFCRQAYHGQMIGCDNCEDWFHFNCAGLSKAQADKCDKYICVRCILKLSIDQCVERVAKIVNKWMGQVDPCKFSESKKLKIRRKVEKEESTIIKLEDQIQHMNSLQEESSKSNLMEAAISPQVVDMEATSSTNLGDSVTNETDSQPKNESPEKTASENPSSVDQFSYFTGQLSKLVELRRELAEAKNRLVAAMNEEESISKSIEYEMQHLEDIVGWMEVVKPSLWPKSPEEVLASRPILRFQGLPKSIEDALMTAQKLGITMISDVTEVIQSFMCFGWAYRCLYALRGPPSCRLVKTLVESSRNVKFVDEKILKFLGHIVSKGRVWKQKARKLTIGNSNKSKHESGTGSQTVQVRQVDSAKLTAIVQEGNLIPIWSKLKDRIKEIYEANVVPVAHPIKDPKEDLSSKKGEKPGRKGKGAALVVSGSHVNINLGYPEFQYASSDEEHESDIKDLENCSFGIGEYCLASEGRDFAKIWPPSPSVEPLTSVTSESRKAVKVQAEADPIVATVDESSVSPVQETNKRKAEDLVRDDYLETSDTKIQKVMTEE